MATSLTLQNDASSPQGYVKVNGTTSATFTTSGITGNLVGNVTGSLTQGGSLTLATAQTASGTSVDFTGIPSWAKRITVMFNGVSGSGSSNFVLQIGSGSIDSTANYTYSKSQQQNAAAINLSNTITGTFVDFFGNFNASATMVGILILTNITGNIWTFSGNCHHVSGTTGMSICVGSKGLSGILDRVRITTVNGTDTFDAGTINISFEG
jgi:hypothetical protein